MRILIVLLAATIAVAAFRSYLLNREPPLVRIEPPPGEQQVEMRDLPRLWAIPDFKLTERSERAVTLSDLKGKIWVADFIYTTCPGPCPMLSSRLSEVQQEVAFAPDVLLVSISTDPEKDTPQILNGYAQRFHATDRWLFLTGDKTQIRDLSNQGFKLSLTEDPSAPEPITHSTKMALVDRQGIVRGFYDGTDPAAVKRLIGDIRRLLGEKL